MATPARSSTRPHTNWAVFAGVMFFVAGAMNILEGVVALANKHYYHVDELLFSSFGVWGVWWLFCGVCQVVVGFGVITRQAWGQLFGVVFAGLNALTQVIFIAVYPAWTIAVVVIDGLIIYGMTLGSEAFD